MHINCNYINKIVYELGKFKAISEMIINEK